MATIKDVAKLAGVSVSTVSRALSNSAAVSVKTKEKIRRAVDELGFVPDYLARSLKNGRTKTISLMVPTILNPFFPRLVNCFSSEIGRYKYATILYVSNYSKQEERKNFESAKTFSTDGILYVPGTDDARHVREMLEFGIPTVIINRRPDVPAPCVTNNDFAGGYNAIEYLIRNGHRRICCFVGDLSLQNMRERYEGCIKAFSDYGLDPADQIFAEDNSSNDIYHFAKQVLSFKNGVSAFFTSSDWMANAVYSGVQSLNLNIPRDISVVGFDDNEDSQYMFPPLTTWHHPIEEIARESVALLLDRLENERDISDSGKILSGRMVIRDSARKIGPAPLKILENS